MTIYSGPTSLERNIITPRVGRGLPINKFLRHYTSCLSIIYIFDLMHHVNLTERKIFSPKQYLYLNYYAKLSRVSKYGPKSIPNVFVFQTLTIYNIIVFSKPRKQLFLVFFKKKPVFIFSGGLMRFIINEPKKSSKKAYKVAISLFKLAAMLLHSNLYFSECYLRLCSIGKIRSKLLYELKKKRLFFKINFIILIFTYDARAQKFKTRRAIKKYIKKRFKLV